METNAAPGTRPVTVKGRVITVKDAIDAQLMLLAREARLAQREGTEKGRRLEAIARIFDILEALVASEEDKEFLLGEMVAGKLELADLTPFLADVEAEAKPKVRRGRPPVKRA